MNNIEDTEIEIPHNYTRNHQTAHQSVNFNRHRKLISKKEEQNPRDLNRGLNQSVQQKSVDKIVTNANTKNALQYNNVNLNQKLINKKMDNHNSMDNYKKYIASKDGCSIMDGFATYQWPDGRKYSGFWQNNKMNGFGVFIWPDGRIYIGQFQNQNKHGYGILKRANGKFYKGYWKEGNANGLGIYQKDWNNLKYGIWENGKQLKQFNQEEVDYIKSGKVNFRSYFQDKLNQEMKQKQSFEKPINFDFKVQEIEQKLNIDLGKIFEPFGNPNNQINQQSKKVVTQSLDIQTFKQPLQEVNQTNIIQKSIEITDKLNPLLDQGALENYSTIQEPEIMNKQRYFVLDKDKSTNSSITLKELKTIREKQKVKFNENVGTEK